MSRPALAAAEHGLRWMREHPAAPEPLLPVADEVWFYQMLLLRHAARFPDQAAGWEHLLDRALAPALRVDPQCRLSSLLVQGDRVGWSDELLGAAMVAHLGWLRQPRSPDTLRRVAGLCESISADSGAIAALPPLHAFCLAYNLREMRLAVPDALCTPDERTVVRGLSGPERLLAAAYFHTHVVLFAFGVYRRHPTDLGALSGSLRFIRAQAPAVERYGWADLCAEFAICLSLTGTRDEQFHRLIGTLIRLQAADGRWTHPRADNRQARHSTMLSILALLEAAPAGTGAPHRPTGVEELVERG
jgi:hypothetical protein